ncbi:MAG TPA: hypothetical protein EYQ75_19645 [Planctomycetaceae bacterium]|nr:hypothetical protein [Planctomycetaceae bacterium]
MKLRLPFVAILLLLALAQVRQSLGQGPGEQPVVGSPVVAPSAILPMSDGVSPVMAASAFSIGGPIWQPAVGAAVLPASFLTTCNDPNCTDPGCTVPSGGGCTDPGCTDLGCGGQCCELGPLGRFTQRFPVCGTWGSIDFLHVWTKGRRLPVLVSTSPGGSQIADAGVLSRGGTALFGGNRVGEGLQSAGRLDLGFWFDDCESNGIGVRFFAVEGDRSGLFATSDGTGVPILATPYFDLNSAQDEAIVAAFPGIFAGSVNARAENDMLSAETYARFLIARSGLDRIDFISGYHYARVSDSVELTSSTLVLGAGGGFPIGTTNVLHDLFDVRNDFHGGILGLTGEFHHRCWTMRTLAKVSLGDMRHRVTVGGSSVTTVPPPPAGGTTSVFPGGIFSQQSNIGTYSENQFSYIPELNLIVGYKINTHVELTCGYNLIYFPHMAFAGDQMDTTLDLTQANGGPVGARPLLTGITDTDFWVQGVSLGLNWTY